MRVFIHRFTWRILAGLVSAGALAFMAAGGASASTHGVRAHSSAQRMTQIRGSYLDTDATETGQLSTGRMSVDVVLKPGDESGLSSLLSALYTPGSADYGHWLAAGHFDSEFAPSQATVQAITAYLQSEGLTVRPTSTPFLLRAIGSSAQIDSAFATSIDKYRNAEGVNFYANAKPASVPAGVASSVLGVVGLTNTVRLQSQTSIEAGPPSPSGHGGGGEPSCEIPYPTTLAELEAIPANGPYNGYGGGPGCSGLTPSQTNSIYNAPKGGPHAQGAGATVAVFELSAYNHGDIADWARTFYGGRSSRPRLQDINVDGGPLAPDTSQCPTGDTCLYGYGGDIEVEADIEQDLSIAPRADSVVVYNAPNDFSGQTELDEYAAIANQDSADSISSSWAVCEPDVGLGYAEAENLIFEQMAAQGQSMFSSSGDTGAFECIRDGTFSAPGHMPLEQLDPASQPWVTSTGGTSFTSFDPGSDPNPSYPFGAEGVWNTVDACSGNNSSSATDPGIVNCNAFGAGGGGHSIFWPMPDYQRGPGVINSDTVYGPSNCALAAAGQPCREGPDISADADPLTGYAEYCTGSTYVSPNNPSGIPYASACNGLTPTPGAPGWFHIGGTSLSAPLWGALFADRDAYQGGRSGNANYLLYALFNSRRAYNADFHDITALPLESNNGFYPVTRNYDEATGIGSPNFTGLITGSVPR